MNDIHMTQHTAYLPKIECVNIQFFMHHTSGIFTFEKVHKIIYIKYIILKIP